MDAEDVEAVTITFCETVTFTMSVNSSHHQGFLCSSLFWGSILSTKDFISTNKLDQVGNFFQKAFLVSEEAPYLSGIGL